MPCDANSLFDTLAPHIGEGGICVRTEADKQLVIRNLNEALPMLMKRLDAEGTLWSWKVPEHNGCFCLPLDCLESRQVFTDGAALEMHDQWYEGRLSGYLEGSGCCPGSALIDVGDGFPIPYAWPPHFDARFGVVALNANDAGQVLRVRVTNRYGHEVAEELTLLPDQETVWTESPVTDVRFIKKPVTQGMVGLYIYYPQTDRRIKVTTLPANITIPSYRKKKMPQGCSCCGEVVIKGKRRFIPIVSEFDSLPICDQDALMFSLHAIAARKRGDLNEYNSQLTFAVNELQKELANTNSAGISTTINFASPFAGRGSFRRCWS